jgi:uncharacterized protein YbjT (DUF2867 family)
MPPYAATRPILVTGATGYVGGRLVPRLLASGYRVRAMGRSLAKLAGRSWAGHPDLELVEGDTLHLPSLARAAAGCEAVFYLVHAMIAHRGAFADADRRSALNMAAAAAAGGVERIIYLSGLGEVENPALSHHLRSRHQVGAILQAGPVPATVLRAAMIMGAGSASFEILRYLVDRLPVMITPRWVQTPCQPISIASVLALLQGCLECPATAGERFDIGDDEILTYRRIIEIYAEEAGLRRRLILPVPLLTPRLSAHWIHLVTPVPAAIALPLTEGLGVPVICRENRIRSLIPIKAPTCRETIRRALRRGGSEGVESCWSDAGCLLPPEWAVCGDAAYAGGTILSCGYAVSLDATPAAVWEPLRRIGGRTGWYFGDPLWRLRGLLDRMVGGYGLRRGRRDPVALRPGDALDFWRVLEVAPGRRLRLLAEMKMPGEALLEFEIQTPPGGGTQLRMLSRFRPRGVAGLVYWWILYPFHELIFSGMLRAIAHASGRPVTAGPWRFTPRLPADCPLPSGEGRSAP